MTLVNGVIRIHSPPAQPRIFVIRTSPSLPFLPTLSVKQTAWAACDVTQRTKLAYGPTSGEVPAIVQVVSERIEAPFFSVDICSNS